MRGWKTAATVVGLLLLAGCVVLVGVLTVAGAPDVTARVVQFLSIAFAVLTPAVSLVMVYRRETVATTPTADQLEKARETLAGVVAQQ